MVVEDSSTTGIQPLDAHTKSVRSILEELDNSKITGLHWKAMITSGMGFFTDAYDLFIIGAALSLLIPLWKLNALEISLIGSTSLLAAAFGSFLFGRLADRVGRHTIYVSTLIVLAIGAVLSALSPNIYWLLAFRFIMGLGIGGDYPLCATLMSEYANRKDRGKLITMVFSMQGLGLILGPLVAIALMLSGINHDLTWRIMLALGAVPALATFYLRRQIKETPRFALMMQQNNSAEQETGNGSTKKLPDGAASNHKVQALHQPRKSWFHLLFTPRYFGWIIGTAGAWFLLDIAYYGTTISSPLVLKSLNSHADAVTNMVYTLLIFVIAALPGYIVSALTIDRLGRKAIQGMGFGMMAIAYGLLALVPSFTQITLPFLTIYALSYFFTEFGPNVTTFVYPAEIFPVMVRSSAHGISAALGKTGAFIGAFIFPYLLSNFHLPGAMAFAAVVSLIGLVLTFVALPEPNQRSLEEISDEHKVLTAYREERVTA
jgi:PHS family inorganic phosphate transporter-like MFS transporter